MPTKLIWTDPEVFLEHAGIPVFHTYREDDHDQGIKRYWFTLNPVCGVEDSLCEGEPCRHVFDVRELSTWQAPVQPPFCTGADDTPENHAAWERYWELETAAMQSAITAAIDSGELTTGGWVERPAPTDNPSPAVAARTGDSIHSGESIPEPMQALA